MAGRAARRRRTREAINAVREIAQIGATRQNVPMRVRWSTSEVCIPFAFFKDADFAEVCSRLGITVLT